MHHSSNGFKAMFAGVALAFACVFGMNSGASAQAPTELRILVFGGTLGAGFMKAISGFEKENNVKFVVTDSTSVQGLTRLLARRGQEPEWDIAHMSPSAHFQGVEAGLWEELSPKLVPAMGEVIPFAVDRGKYPGWGVLAFGLQVNTEALKKAGVAEPTSWKDLWKPEYKSRIAINDFANAYAQAFLDMVAQIEGSQEAAFAALKRLQPNVSRFPFTPAELDNLLLQSEVWVAPNSDSRANLLSKKGAPIKFIHPSEGSGAWLVHLDIPKGARNRDLAIKLVNYVLRADTQARLAVSAQVGPVHPKAVLTAAEAQGITHGDGLKKLRPLRWDQIVPKLNALHDRWNREFQK